MLSNLTNQACPKLQVAMQYHGEHAKKIVRRPAQWETRSNIKRSIRFWKPMCAIHMVLKTEPGIEPFFLKFPVQPRFLTDFWPVLRLLTGPD